MTADRVLLLVPAETYRARDFLLAADRMGLDVVVGSDGALPLGDRPVVRVAPDELDRSVDRIVSRVGTVSAVVAVDGPMLQAAAILAVRMGLRHSSSRSLEAAGNKSLQRHLWAARSIPQPAFRLLGGTADAGAVATTAETVGFPCVIKPVSLSGSRGVLRADDEDGAVGAVRLIRDILEDAGRPADEPVLVERYLDGAEVSVDGLLDEGRLTSTVVLDKPDASDGPTFEETLLVAPPDLPESALQSVVQTAGRAARALGLRRGPIHAELRVQANPNGWRPMMLELAARSIGGLCSRAFRFRGGESLEELILANALGRTLEPPALSGPSGALMLHPELSGVLRAVEGRADATAVPGITGVSITVPVGQSVRPLPEGDRYLGFILAAGDTRDVVIRALRTARDRLRIVID